MPETSSARQVLGLRGLPAARPVPHTVEDFPGTWSRQRLRLARPPTATASSTPPARGGPRLVQCSGGPGRLARALQPGSDIHPRNQPAAAPPPPPRKAREGAPREGRGRPRRRVASLGRGRRGQGRGQGLHDRGERASTVVLCREPVGVARHPAGRGTGAPTWWESFETAKVAGHCGGGGGRGAGRLAPPSREGRKEKKRGEAGVGVGSGRQRLEQIPPPRGGGQPERGGTDSLLPHGQDEETSSPPPLFFMPTSISTRAHIRRLYGFFFPLGRKNEESKRREGKEKNSSAGSALCRGRAQGRGRHPPALSALRRVPVGGRARAPAPGNAARLLDAPIDLAAAAAGRRDRGEKGPASTSPSSQGAPRPAGPRRQEKGGKQREGGRSGGPGGARSGRPARRWMRRPGSLETTLPCDAPGGLQGPRLGAPRRL